jgi:hypothetical protein
MSKEKKNLEKIKKSDPKIHFGQKTSVCFACGQKISLNTKICPYCDTKQPDL